jgi:hypothetical protein
MEGCSRTQTKFLINRNLDIPPPWKLPCILVGDDTYWLSMYRMRHYSKNISHLRNEYLTTGYLIVDTLLNVHLVFLQKGLKFLQWKCYHWSKYGTLCSPSYDYRTCTEYVWHSHSFRGTIGRQPRKWNICQATNICTKYLTSTFGLFQSKQWFYSFARELC